MFPPRLYESCHSFEEREREQGTETTFKKQDYSRFRSLGVVTSPWNGLKVIKRHSFAFEVVR